MRRVAVQVGGDVRGDVVMHDKIVHVGDDNASHSNVPELMQHLPRVPQGYRGPIPLLDVYSPAPVDAYLFRGVRDDTPVVQIDRSPGESLLPFKADLHEYLEYASGRVALIGPPGAGKTTGVLRRACDIVSSLPHGIVYFDARGAFGFRLSEMARVRVSMTLNDLRPYVGAGTVSACERLRDHGVVVLDHAYLLPRHLSALAIHIVEAIAARFQPRLVIITERSGVSPLLRQLQLRARHVNIIAFETAHNEVLRAAYRPYLAQGVVEHHRAITSTPEDAVEIPVPVATLLSQLADDILTHAPDGLGAVDLRRRLPALFRTCLAAHPNPIAQVEAINILCDGDLLAEFVRATATLQELVARSLLLQGESRLDFYLGDVQVATRIAAAEPATGLPRLGGALLDIVTLQVQDPDKRSARSALEHALRSSDRTRHVTEALDDLRRRAGAAAGYLACDGPLTKELERKVRMLRSRLLAAVQRATSPEERESLMRDAVGLAALCGAIPADIVFHRVLPGPASFEFLRGGATQSVEVSYTYYSAITPLTTWQYHAFARLLGVRQSGAPAHRACMDPQTGLTWDQWSSFAEALSSVLGRAVRCGVQLPSVPEWARARDVLDAGWAERNANVLGLTTCLGHRTPVGLWTPPPNGGVDFAAGVLEWTRSSWGSNEVATPGFASPYDPEDGREAATALGMRMLRGSSWLYAETDVQCSCVLPPSADFPDIGMRPILRFADDGQARSFRIRVCIDDTLTLVHEA